MRKALFVLMTTIIFVSTPALAFALETWSYFTIIGSWIKTTFGIQEPANIDHVVTYTLVALLLVVSGIVIGGRYRKKLVDYDAWKKQPLDTRGPSPIDPSPKFSPANFFETVIQMLLGLMEEIIGHGAKKFLPLIGALTFVILFSNLMALIPGSAVPTSNFNTNVAMAVTVFFMYHFFGIREHGILKYLAHFMGPLEGPIKYIMAPLMIPIELISHFARPLSLSLRLLGNMFGDHTVFAVFMGLVALPLIYPLPFLGLGLLVCVVQTLVFVMLTTVYISLAVAHDH